MPNAFRSADRKNEGKHDCRISICVNNSIRADGQSSIINRVLGEIVANPNWLQVPERKPHDSKRTRERGKRKYKTDINIFPVNAFYIILSNGAASMRRARSSLASFKFHFAFPVSVANHLRGAFFRIVYNFVSLSRLHCLLIVWCHNKLEKKMQRPDDVFESRCVRFIFFTLFFIIFLFHSLCKCE